MTLPNSLAWRACASMMAICAAAMPGACKVRDGDPAALCASASSAAKIKSIVFQRAAASAPAASLELLPKLASQTSVTLADPLLVSYDHDTRRISCQAEARFRLPQGVAAPAPNPREI